MESQVGIINNGSNAEFDWDWSNVTVPCAEDRASAGGYGNNYIARLANNYWTELPEIIDTLVEDAQGKTGQDHKELESLVCSDFRNVLDILRENPYAIVTICKALGIESNVEG